MSYIQDTLKSAGITLKSALLIGAAAATIGLGTGCDIVIEGTYEPEPINPAPVTCPDPNLGYTLKLDLPDEVKRVLNQLGPYPDARGVLESAIQAYYDFPVPVTEGYVEMTDVQGNQNPVEVVLNGRIDTETFLGNCELEGVFEAVDP